MQSSARILSEKRRILLVTNDLGPRAGGIETFILGLIDQLTGQEIVIYTSAQSGSEEFDRELLRQTGALVIRDKRKVLLPTLRVTRAVSEVMKKYQSETIWFGAAMPLAAMAGHLKRAGARKIVALTHGHEVWWAKVPPFNRIFARSTKSIDVLTYLGEFTRSAMAPIVAPSCQMVQIAPGIALSHFTPGVKSSELLAQYNLVGKKVILSVGRLVHRKGQDKLIEALPEIIAHHPDVILLFVGIGPRRAHLDSMIVRLKLNDYVRFVGRVGYSELPEYFRLADLFAMPSRSRLAGLEVEGLGIVYLEASASGIAVLGGESGGAPDAVLVGETGEVVDGRNPALIAAAINSMLDDPERLARMGVRGRQWAQEMWSWEIWGKRFAQLLSSS
jgi:phosphatidylinositol alpha-1,6-mannosyltransferase